MKISKKYHKTKTGVIKRNPRKKYNGWANYQTWNVALWIDNDEGLYRMAKQAGSYKKFVVDLQEFKPNAIAYQTPDKVSWTDSGLDLDELEDMFVEFLDH